MANKELIKRLETEEEELEYKCELLGAFILSNKFREINYTQQLLLPAQLSAMKTYLIILGARLEDLIDSYDD